MAHSSAVFIVRMKQACQTSNVWQETHYLASMLTDTFVLKVHLAQYTLCTRKTELALKVKFYLDFHWVTRATLVTNGSDVKDVIPRCRPARIAEICIWRHFRWPAFIPNSVTVGGMKVPFECKPRSSWTQLILWQMYLTNSSVLMNIEAKYLVSGPSLITLTVNSASYQNCHFVQ